jgi:hypothetical protein
MAENRATYISVPDMYRLKVAGMHLSKVFNASPMLVGSALTKRDYRDVDIRMILPDSEFEGMFPNKAWLMLANAALTDWMAKSTGLPIDFQFQGMTEANAEFDGPRRPIGTSFEYSPAMTGNF